MAINCCKDCVPPKRFPGCHGSCAAYLKEKAEWDAMRKAMQRERNAGRDVDAFMLRRINYCARRSKYKGGQQ